jgi:hypothetical protein
VSVREVGPEAGHPPAPDDASSRPPPPALRQVLDRLAATLETAGMPRMPARVLLMLMAGPPDGLTAAELCSRLRVSPAAVSGAVRYLQQWGIVERVHEHGSRRHRYVLHEETWYTASLTKSAFLRRVGTLAREGAALAGPGSPAGRRFAEMAEFLSFVTEETDGIVARWHDRRRDGPAAIVAAGSARQPPGT